MEYFHLVNSKRTHTRCGVALSEKVQELLRPRSDTELQLVPEDAATCPDCLKSNIGMEHYA